jgi:hypothetical protein
MEYRYLISVPIFNFKCYVVIVENLVEAMNKDIEKGNWDVEPCKPTDKVHGMAVDTGKPSKYYIYYSSSKLTADTIAHEVSHIIDYVFDYKGIQNDTETRAYLMGYLCGRIFEHAIKNKILVSKWLQDQQEKPKKQRKKKEELVKNPSSILPENNTSSVSSPSSNIKFV